MALLFMAIGELAHNKARHFAAFGRSDAHCVSRACANRYGFGESCGK